MLSRLRKYKAYFLIILINYAVLELCSYAIYGQLTGRSFSFSTLAEQRTKALKETHRELKKTPEDSSPHPFVGYVWNYPKMKQVTPYTDGAEENATATTNNSLAVKPYGYRAEEDPFVTSKDPGAVIVAITGASLAEFLYMDGVARNVIRTHIQKIPAYKNKRIVFIMLGRNSYQQPQQLFSVAYYLLQGGRLDVLINLDGHNESSYAFENQGNHRNPTFPLYWPQYTGNFSDVSVSYLADAALWRHIRSAGAKVSGYLSYSVTASTFWSMFDIYCFQKAIQAESASNTDTSNMPNARPYFVTGSDFMQSTPRKELAKYAMDFWERSSLQIYDLSKAYHFQYFHFLQPHQYAEGSKELSDVEKKNFYTLEAPANRDVKEFYPLFQEGIHELQAKGVQAFSLVDVYKNTKETIYRDSCCHVNPLGNKMMGDAIGKRIEDTLTK